MAPPDARPRDIIAFEVGRALSIDTSARELPTFGSARRPPHALVTLGDDLLRMVLAGPVSPDDRAFSSAPRA